MKNIVLLAAILISICASALAQSKKKPEFFAGYSYENLNTGVSSSDFTATTTSLDNRFNLNGLNLSGADYLTRRVGSRLTFQPISTVGATRLAALQRNQSSRSTTSPVGHS